MSDTIVTQPVVHMTPFTCPVCNRIQPIPDSIVNGGGCVRCKFCGRAFNRVRRRSYPYETEIEFRSNWALSKG